MGAKRLKMMMKKKRRNEGAVLEEEKSEESVGTGVVGKRMEAEDDDDLE